MQSYVAPVCDLAKCEARLLGKAETMFRRVIDFNHQFGVIPSPTMKVDGVFFQRTKTVERCMALIREEMQELEDGVKKQDPVETVDALCDLMYVVLGMGTAMGVDLDVAFSLVHENNMSKLCSTEEEAILTVRFYMTRLEGDYPLVTYRKTEGGKYAVYNYTTGKVLKSINWKPVDLNPVLTTNVVKSLPVCNSGTCPEPGCGKGYYSSSAYGKGCKLTCESGHSWVHENKSGASL